MRGLVLFFLLLAASARAQSLFARIHERPWSFVQIGDLHAGTVLVQSSWSNTVNAILSSNKVWNLKLLVSPGDCYEQETNAFNFQTNASGHVSLVPLTNDLWKLKAAGISCFVVPGNHDGDSDTALGATHIIHWNDV